MSRVLYYIWLFTRYPKTPYAYPIFHKLSGNLTTALHCLSEYLPARRPQVLMDTLFSCATPIRI